MSARFLVALLSAAALQVSATDVAFDCPVHNPKPIIPFTPTPTPGYGPGWSSPPVMAPSTMPSSDDEICITKTEPEVVSRNGNYPTTGDTLRITQMSQDGTTVDFKIRQNWTTNTIETILVHFTPVGGSGPVCQMFSNSVSGPLPPTFKASCTSMNAVVTVVARDPIAFPNQITYQAPSTCTSFPAGNTTWITYNVPCNPGCGERVVIDTRAPTRLPTTKPSSAPTKAPTKRPTVTPVRNPTKAPTKSPTKAPTRAPTKAPTKPPTRLPTKKPTGAPIGAPIQVQVVPNPPTRAPTRSPTRKPTKSPTKSPTKNPTKRPTKSPTKSPTMGPTKRPTKAPTRSPTKNPTKRPTKAPTKAPTSAPTVCVPRLNVTRIARHGSVEPAGNLLRITEQSSDGRSVRFQVMQEYKLAALQLVAVQYEDVNWGMKCNRYQNAVGGAIPGANILAKCVDGWANVTVFARDDCFSSVPPYTLPGTCGGDSGSSVMQHFRVPCSPGCPGYAPLYDPLPSPAPTKAPVRPPSKAPTKFPTKAPTKRPTRSPTRKPTAAPVSACVPLTLRETAKSANITAADAVISNIRQVPGAATVTFTVSQFYKLTNLAYLAVQYNDPTTGASLCPSTRNVPSGVYGGGPNGGDFTARCVNNVAVVRVYGYDDCFMSFTSATIPAMCSPPATGRSVMTEFSIPCSTGC